LEQSVQISEIQIIEEITEKAESRDKKQEAAEEEEEEKEEGEEGKLQRRLWERKAANQQTIETVKMNQEPFVLVIVPDLASSYDVATLCSEVNSPHHLGNLRDKQYSEVCQELFRRNSKRKAKHKTKASNQRNNRRKKKVKVSLNFRLGSEAPIPKKCKSHLCQQISNPYRKEVRDEGGTGKVVPLGKQIELVSYY
jgi:hypothetical protein